MKLKPFVLEHLAKRSSLNLRNQIQLTLQCSERSLQRHRDLNVTNGELTKKAVLDLIATDMGLEPEELLTTGPTAFSAYVQQSISPQAYAKLHKTLEVHSIDYAHQLIKTPKLLTLSQIQALVDVINAHLAPDQMIHACQLIREFQAGYQNITHDQLLLLSEEYELLTINK